MTKYHHRFHLVNPSPSPMLVSFSIFNNLIMSVAWFHNLNYPFLILSISSTLLCMYLWWRDVIREATYSGSHTKAVYKGMRMGMVLFIISELLFFMSFFWAYFHSVLSPAIEIGQSWPPLGIIPFNPYNIPLLNTVILISSGLTITWSHHAMLNNNFKESIMAFIYTTILGMCFTIIQLTVYKESNFTIADSMYGSTFFVATAFHGFHVLIETPFLLVTLSRMYLLHFSPHHHFGFEAAAWYWHFVDVVWLFLYLSIYWWGF